MSDNLSLADLYTHFQTKFPGQEWFEWEPETLLLEGDGSVGEVSGLLLDKVWILKILLSLTEPNKAIADPALFLHVCDAVNGNPADFGFVPEPNSLEVAWALRSLTDLSRVASLDLRFGYEIGVLCKHVLINDGYSSTPPPFDFIQDKAPLVAQSDLDATKVKAIDMYIRQCLRVDPASSV